MDFAVLADHRVKLKESEKKDKYQELTKELKKKLIELKKLYNMKVTVIPIVIGALGTGPGGFENERTSGDHPNYSIIEIGQNTEKSPGDLKRLAVTHSAVRKAVGKNLKRSNK